MNESITKKGFLRSERLQKISFIFIFIGVVTLLSGLIFGDHRKVGSAYLVSFCYFVFLSLGTLFFVAIQHVSHAGWSANIRRMMESLSYYIVYLGFLAIPLVYFGDALYEWYHASHVEEDPILKQKSVYLNIPFFVTRLFVFFLGWWFFYKKLLGFSISQDADGKAIWNQKAEKYSIFFLLFFVFSFSFLSVDLLMSLDPHWFSTIFGVYTFAGSFQSALAVMVLFTIYLIPRSDGKIGKDHLHDLGKFLMGITLFWAYIAFSQYMLIWYANWPEETTFFIPRSQKPWMWVSLSLVVFKFAVPFICLLPRWVKRNFNTMIGISILILMMQYVDIYWLVYPSLDDTKLIWGVWDIGLFIGFLGGFILSVVKFSERYPLIALKDPREQESTTHHVTY